MGHPCHLTWFPSAGRHRTDARFGMVAVGTGFMGFAQQTVHAQKADGVTCEQAFFAGTTNALFHTGC